MKKINLLDCTLRDGGYYNNWDFSRELIEEYLSSVAQSGIQYVELGFRSKQTDSYMGPCAFTKDSFIESLRIPKKLKIGIMINASEVLSNMTNKKDFFNFVIENKKTKISFVRFACHFDEVEKLIPYINTLKNSGLKIILNLMQITEKSSEEIRLTTKKISKSITDVLYFADSMGGLSPEKINDIIKDIRQFWKKEIGFHAHDNMGKALINAEQAINSGVNWIDSTITGMGRGPGNVKTEYALIQFKEKLNSSLNLAPILDLIENQFEKLKQKHKWGSNVYYFLSGLHGIHPTFIQSMLTDLNLKPIEMLSIIENLKNNKATKFNKNLIEIGKQIYKGKTTGLWSPLSLIKKREVLILGSGPGSKKHSEAIEKFIKIKKPFVIALNDQKSIKEKYIDIRVACHTLRLASNLNRFKKITQPLVMPLKRLSENQLKDLAKNKILDYGLELQSGKFIFKKNSAVMPNSLTICYALSIANSGKAKTIFISGLDGYPIEDPKRAEMDEVLRLYSLVKKSPKIISITPTRYKLKSLSVYAY
jgi:4-hydroxy 2-oxovalerate aldolase